MRVLCLSSVVGVTLTCLFTSNGLSDELRPPAAAAAVTAVSGRVLGPDGNGLAGIKIADNAEVTHTDAAGRFVLAPIPPGKSTLRVDGTRGGVHRNTDYGQYEIRVTARAGAATILPYDCWLKPLDHSHDVHFPSPTTSDVTVKTPLLPGMEVHIPPGVVIKDINGVVVTEIGITAIPGTKTPFPLAPGTHVPTFFTLQPGGACLFNTKGGIGVARILYPNTFHELPGARATVWRYEPDEYGWNPYGTGVVSKDGSQIIPDRGVVVTDFGSAECAPSTRSHQNVPKRIDLRRLAQ